MTNNDKPELREKYESFNHISDGRILATPEELEAYFNQHTNALIDELVEKMPRMYRKALDVGDERSDVFNAEVKGFNECLDQVLEIIKKRRI